MAEANDIKIVPTCLRMDRRVCRTDVHCIWYDDRRDGEPCFTSFDRCEMVQKLVEEATGELESSHADEIDKMADTVESLRGKVKELSTELADARSEHDPLWKQVKALEEKNAQ